MRLIRRSGFFSPSSDGANLVADAVIPEFFDEGTAD